MPCPQIIRCLLIVPNPESALNEEAGKLLLEKCERIRCSIHSTKLLIAMLLYRYDDFAARARIMTSIHAKPKKGESGASCSRRAGLRWC